MKFLSFVSPLFLNSGRENLDINRGYVYSFRDEPVKETMRARVAKCGVVYCKVDSDCPKRHRCNIIGKDFSICLIEEVNWNQEF